MNEIPLSDRLYNLLPAIYRQRDSEQGEALRGLMAVIEGELGLLEADVQGLYDNWFIETCDEWVVPYLGDLLGIRGLNDEQNAVVSQRARVANAIHASRRKGTVVALEQLVRDSSGWHVKAVEFFERLTTTQHVRHIRPASGGAFDVRQAAGAWLNSPFDVSAHTPDVRGRMDKPGKYDIPDVGIFLWRLGSYPLTHSPARAVAQPDDGRYTFSPTGQDAPLFNLPQNEGDPAQGIRMVDLPVAIRPEDFERDLALHQERYKPPFPEEHRPANTDYYGPQRSLSITRVDQADDGTEHSTPIPAMQVIASDLGDWVRPPAGKVAVDVRLGRLAFPEGETPTAHAEVSFHYGFSADIGGGSYDRHRTLAEPVADTWQASVSKQGPLTTLQQALNEWPATRPGIIQIADNQVYGGDLSITLQAGSRLVIEAADGARPNLRLIGNLEINAPSSGMAELSLNGLLIEGGIQVKGNLALTITHCTLVPGRILGEKGQPTYPDYDSLQVGKSETEVSITHSIVGPLRLSAACKRLSIQDSIVDAPAVQGKARPAIAANDAQGYGPATSIERATVFGPLYLSELSLASEVIFSAPVKVKNDQGCVRYSYVPSGSNTPARFRCQPDLALAQQAKDKGKPLSSNERALTLARLRPRFTSTCYGEPGYAQRGATCAPEITNGAADDGEMGVFHDLYQSQRETNLRLVLDETLRLGLRAGIFYIT